jgi:hypothetical protein
MNSFYSKYVLIISLIIIKMYCDGEVASILAGGGSNRSTGWNYFCDGVYISLVGGWIVGPLHVRFPPASAVMLQRRKRQKGANR